jgi:ribosomal protein L7/L12
MEYIIATILLTFLAIVILSKNDRNNNHSHLPEDNSSLERIEYLLQQIQAHDRPSEQIPMETQVQLNRIEQKLDLIIQEFDIKNNRQNSTDPLQLQTEFDLILNQFPRERKISIIKAVRMITGLGLKEAKELVESSMPVVVKQRLSAIEAEKAQALLQESGAKVSLR